MQGNQTRLIASLTLAMTQEHVIASMRQQRPNNAQTAHSPQLQPLAMRERHSDGVRYIKRLDVALDSKNPLDHERDLLLFRLAIARERLFDLQRRVFGEIANFLQNLERQRAAKLGELEHGLGIVGIENVLNRDTINPMLAQDELDSLAKLENLMLQDSLMNPDEPRLENALRTWLCVQYAIAAIATARVDSENHISCIIHSLFPCCSHGLSADSSQICYNAR